MGEREMIVPGTPRSLQGSSRGVRAWKDTIVEAARGRYDEEVFSIQELDVAVRILHICPSWGYEGDLDNIAKPILDALTESHRVLFNDNQVKELLLRRIEWEAKRIATIERATPLLASTLDKALTGDGPEEFVYIYVTTALSLEALP